MRAAIRALIVWFAVASLATGCGEAGPVKTSEPRPSASALPDMATDEPGGTPVTYWVHPQLENRNRLTVAFRFILMIPAALFVFLIAIVAWICGFLAFWAVLFTGRWPGGLREWVMKLLRVEIRLSAYVYLLVDEYPPFNTD